MNKQSSTINLLDMAQQTDYLSHLEFIRLGADELPVIPFTTDVSSTKIHYCNEDEIRGYVQCNEPDCILCLIGRKQDERFLLPVYLPTQGTVGVLPISPSLQPFALLPQMLEVLQKEEQQVIFIRREGMTKFHVTTSPLTEGADTGETHIKAFLEKMESVTVDLTAVFNRLSNKQLAAVPSIAENLRLKGINPDDLG
jgi:hypothetical protein